MSLVPAGLSIFIVYLEASDPKCINFMLNIIEVNSLRIQEYYNHIYNNNAVYFMLFCFINVFSGKFIMKRLILTEFYK